MEKKKVTKAELVDSIYTKTSSYAKENRGITRVSIQDVIDSFFLELKTALSEGKTIEFRGFGTFESRKRKGKSKARNPKTGEIVSVEEHNVVIFRSGRDLKNLVWSKK